jgi:hypothetical protein
MKSRTTKISKIKIGEKRKFKSGALRHVSKGKGMPVLISPLVEDLLAKHCEAGLEAGYAPRNWERGLVLGETFNSIQRHLRAEKEGLTDEKHDVAAFWNLMVYLHTKEMIRRGLLPEELDNMPNYVPKKCPKHPKYKPIKQPKYKCDICLMVWENCKTDV